VERGPQPHGVPTGVGLNAVGAAAVRAAESRRGDRLFDDQLAAAFVAAAGRPWRFPAKDEAAAAPFWTTITAALVVRTRFFDEFLAGAYATGIRQFVVLAAGLDTRAYRLSWPRGARLWELELPDVLAFKEQVLTAMGAVPNCQRLALRTDLRGDWRATLERAGFRPGLPTAWLAEGLLIYLTPEENDRLLAQISGLSAPRSRLGLSVSSHAVLESQSKHAALDALGDYSARVGSRWRSGFVEEPGDWLRQHGWRSHAYDPAERAAVYGRPVEGLCDPQTGSGIGWLVVAEHGR
jgi:methyltransferase (TIGR00027 family)